MKGETVLSMVTVEVFQDVELLELEVLSSGAALEWLATQSWYRGKRLDSHY